MFQMCKVSHDLGDFALLHLCLKLIKTICSLLCHLRICYFAFAVAVAIRDSSLLCDIDTAETLAFRDSGLFCHLDTAIAGVVFLATVKFLLFCK